MSSRDGVGRALALGCLLSSVAAAEAQDVHPPSREALALARGTRPDEIPGASIDGQAEDIVYRLLRLPDASRRAACDPNLAACHDAAERIAHQAVLDLARDARDRRDEFLAYAFDSTMSPAEIAEAAKFVKTPAGRSFVVVLREGAARGMLKPEVVDRINRAIAARPLPLAWDEAKLFNRFYAETADLPRGGLPSAPPPIQTRR